MITSTTKKDIRQLSQSELEEVFKGIGEPRFRARQVHEWLWKKGAHSFDAMTNLSKKLREFLDENFAINGIAIDKVQHSTDGTIKSRFRLHDGHLIESVLIPVPADNRYTACVSSQVGCSLTCKFCATGRMKRVRNLDAGEIYDQVVLVNRQSEEKFGHPLTNIVYMGMGEPLLAYKNVLESVDRLTSPDGLNMSPRRITISASTSTSSRSPQFIAEATSRSGCSNASAVGSTTTLVAPLARRRRASSSSLAVKGPPPWRAIVPVMSAA